MRVVPCVDFRSMVKYKPPDRLVRESVPLSLHTRSQSIVSRAVPFPDLRGGGAFIGSPRSRFPPFALHSLFGQPPGVLHVVTCDATCGGAGALAIHLVWENLEIILHGIGVLRVVVQSAMFWSINSEEVAVREHSGLSFRKAGFDIPQAQIVE